MDGTRLLAHDINTNYEENVNNDSISKNTHVFQLKKKYKAVNKRIKDGFDEKELKSKIEAYTELGEISRELNDDIDAFNNFGKAYKLLTPSLKKSKLGVRVIGNYSVTFLHSGNLKYALYFLFEKGESLETIHETDYYILKYLNYIDIASVYHKLGNEKMSVFYYKKAIEFSKTIDDTLWQSSANNNLGYHYYIHKEFDKALEYYYKAKQLLDTTTSKHLLFDDNINENIAHIYFSKKQYKKASDIYTSVSALRRSLNQDEDAIRADISKIVCFRKIKEYKKIDELIRIIDLYYTNNTSKVQNYSDPYYEGYINTKLLYYRESKSFEKARELKDKYLSYIKGKYKYKEKLNKKAISDYLDLIKEEYENRIYLEEQVVLGKEKINQKQKRIMISIGIISVLALALLFSIIKIKRSKQKRLEQESIITKLELNKTIIEKEKLDLELESKQKDIMNIVSSSSMKINYLKHLLTRINNKATSNKEKVFLKSIKLDINNQIKIEERLMTLQSDLSTVNSYFIEKLLALYPNLSKTEREICSFIKLNLSIKEIAQIRYTSVDSVKMARSRIRKKMDLSPEDELEFFIQSI